MLLVLMLILMSSLLSSSTLLSSSSSSSSSKVVILGGGIHGSSLAYWLAKKGVHSTVVERCSPAAAASGKAGGFLAKNWGSGLKTLF